MALNLFNTYIFEAITLNSTVVEPVNPTFLSCWLRGHLIDFLHLAGNVFLVFFCCSIGAGCLFYVSFWCDSVSCNGLSYSGFQPFSKGKRILFIQVAGFELTECLICTSLSPSSCVTEFWLNNIQIPLWVEETPVLSEKSILFFLPALTHRGAAMTAISSNNSILGYAFITHLAQ